MDKEDQKTQQPEQQFAIQRLYVKNKSFEVPNAPEVFKQNWEPQLHLDINTQSQVLSESEGLYNVNLRLTVTVKNKDANAFLAEVDQSGIFVIKGLNDQQLSHTLGSFCPSILYPYARQVITTMVADGSFPQLVLAPVNFDALYVQHQEQLAKQKSEAAGA